MRYDTLARFATCYDADPDETVTFSMPESLDGLDDAELHGLLAECEAAFNAVYEQEGAPSAEDIEAMASLADAADAIRAEVDRREEQRRENEEQAAALAERMRGPTDTDDEADGEPSADEPSAEGDPAEQPAAETHPAEEPAAETTDAPAVEAQPEPVAAANRPVNVTLSGLRRRQTRTAPSRDTPATRATLVASGDLGNGVAPGAEITFADAAEAVCRRAAGVNEQQYRAAYDSGDPSRRLQSSFGVLALRTPWPAELRVEDSNNADEVLKRAVDESRLPGESLVAAGGWCSPSETSYDLFELHSTDGLVSFPEVNVARGGLRFTRGPDFSTLFADTGFSFTEAEAEAGDYDGYGGDKPCFTVTCPTFVDERLEVTGLCITAGILQNRAYPETTEHTIRGAMAGHQHRMARQAIDRVEADSDAVAMPAGQIGALAPVLTAIELQVEHYRYVHRMTRATTLEAIFPYWIRGVIRSDMSRRLGVDLTSVSNARINEWFAERGVAPQFVYNYQDLNGAAASQTAWPTDVRFLLYAAGTWVRGVSDLITLEAVFDSALFRANDFTALFTEEAWLMARRGTDSREVTVPICADGATHGGVDIDCDGTLAA